MQHALVGLVAMLVEVVPPIYRFLAPPPVRYEHVRDAARAAFVEKRVHATRGRTGLLVYIAVRERLNRMFAESTGQPYEKVARETERNLWMTAEEAKSYGLVGRIVESLSQVA